METLSGRLVIGNDILAGRVVVLNGVLQAVELDDRVDGPYIAPGLVDIHLHGSGGHDVTAGREALDAVSAYLVTRGVTSFLPTSVSAPIDELARFGASVREWSHGPPPAGAQPLGFNLEGPFLSPARSGAQNPANLRMPRDIAWRQLEPLLDGLRLITVAPELAGSLDLISKLTRRGVVVSLGHSNANVDEAVAGYESGASATTHLFNAMSNVDHHAPGLAAAALARDSAYVELVADGHHVHPALWKLIWRTKPPERLVLVSDATSLAGSTQARARLGGLDVEVSGDRATLTRDGTLAGSIISIDAAVRNLVHAGLDLPRAIRAASSNPLRLIGVHDRGRIEPGLRADLLVLDDNLQVSRVMLAGSWVV